MKYFTLFQYVQIIATIILYIITLVADIGIKSSSMLAILIIAYILFLICEFC